MEPLILVLANLVYIGAIAVGLWLLWRLVVAAEKIAENSER